MFQGIGPIQHHHQHGRLSGKSATTPKIAPLKPATENGNIFAICRPTSAEVGEAVLLASSAAEIEIDSHNGLLQQHKQLLRDYFVQQSRPLSDRDEAEEADEDYGDEDEEEEEEEDCPVDCPQPMSGENDSSNNEGSEGQVLGSSGSTTASYRTMVAAMNELLSSPSSTTNSVCSTTKADNVSNRYYHHRHHGKSSLNDSNKSIVKSDEGQHLTKSNSNSIGVSGYPSDFDHMYASMTDGNLGSSPQRGGPKNDVTEVKHLKELLLLHLDLIQQQSEQIVNKDKLLAALKHENEMLKLRLDRLHPKSDQSNENSLDINAPNSPQSSNSSNIASSDSHTNHTKNQEQLILGCSSEAIGNSSSPLLQQPSEGGIKIRLNTSGGITTVKQEFNSENNDLTNREEWSGKRKRKTEQMLLLAGVKRTRGASSSSNVSIDTTSSLQGIKSMMQDKSDSNGKKDKTFKKESFLTTEEHYYTAVGEPHFNLCLSDLQSMEEPTNLEVPSWRVKSYPSCYSMEGTENLEDEIFNKRHLKLENDEKRRKRWDSQRIREQRHIEKLKQRQEKQNHHPSCQNTSHTGPCQASMEEEAITSLWPDPEQIQFIQVDDMLPVCAFGELVPAMEASAFSIPWLIGKKKSRRRGKRLTSRRKSSKR